MFFAVFSPKWGFIHSTIIQITIYFLCCNVNLDNNWGTRIMTITNRDFLEQVVSGYFMSEVNGMNFEGPSGPVLLFADDPKVCDQYREIIACAGLRVENGQPISEADNIMARQLNASAVVAHIDNIKQASCQAMIRMEAYCAVHSLPLLLVFDLTLLDIILEHVSYHGVEHIIIDEQARQRTDLPAEIIVSLPRSIQQSNAHVFSNRDEIDVVDLKKISADVERIARALNDLSKPELQGHDRGFVASPFIEDEMNSSVADAPVSFKSESQGELKAYGFAGDSSNETIPNHLAEAQGPVSATEVRDLIKARRLRDQYFDAELFADPAWDMLLDLMAARLESVNVSVSSLCIAAGVPPTTALRWIKTMTEEKIFVRQADEKDGRRIFITLSDEATAGMIGFFSMIRRSKLMIV